MAQQILGGGVVKLTSAEQDYLNALLNYGDRAGFYLGYAQMTGSE